MMEEYTCPGTIDSEASPGHQHDMMGRETQLMSGLNHRAMILIQGEGEMLDPVLHAHVGMTEAAQRNEVIDVMGVGMAADHIVTQRRGTNMASTRADEGELILDNVQRSDTEAAPMTSQVDWIATEAAPPVHGLSGGTGVDPAFEHLGEIADPETDETAHKQPEVVPDLVPSVLTRRSGTAVAQPGAETGAAAGAGAVLEVYGHLGTLRI
jgi:hypothetical protein